MVEATGSGLERILKSSIFFLFIYVITLANHNNIFATRAEMGVKGQDMRVLQKVR